jgi:hypothetical protein
MSADSRVLETRYHLGCEGAHWLVALPLARKFGIAWGFPLSHNSISR